MAHAISCPPFFCALALYFIGHPLLSTERVSKSRLVSRGGQVRRAKKNDL